MHAYDIELLPHGADRDAPDHHGWCFGLPPGIRPEHWPLDPNTGYPLMHGFTLLLPPDYQVHGPEIVALSFFALAPDQNDGEPDCVDGIESVLLTPPPDKAPSDAALLPFWQAARTAHPRLHRMKDILGGAYAVVLLTEAEFRGPLCPPPTLPANNPLLAQSPQPRWLREGSAASFAPKEMRTNDFFYKIFGAQPAPGHATHYALRWRARQEDPNAGVTPQEDGAGDYQPFYYWNGNEITQENYREHDWAQTHQPNHLGGTMRPIQAMPAMSPFYIEFEEYLGGYNFGSGNAQLDFRDMKLDWAC